MTKWWSRLSTSSHLPLPSPQALLSPKKGGRTDLMQTSSFRESCAAAMSTNFRTLGIHKQKQKTMKYAKARVADSCYHKTLLLSQAE